MTQTPSVVVVLLFHPMKQSLATALYHPLVLHLDYAPEIGGKLTYYIRYMVHYKHGTIVYITNPPNGDA